jgi:FAD/FMN-containing dehydrogenase
MPGTSQEIKKFLSNFKGEILDDSESKEHYSRDASLFHIEPEVIVVPKDTEDVKTIGERS